MNCCRPVVLPLSKVRDQHKDTLTSVNSTSFAVWQLMELGGDDGVCRNAFARERMDQRADFDVELRWTTISPVDANIDLEQGRSRASTS